MHTVVCPWYKKKQRLAAHKMEVLKKNPHFLVAVSKLNTKCYLENSLFLKTVSLEGFCNKELTWDADDVS